MYAPPDNLSPKAPCGIRLVSDQAYSRDRSDSGNGGIPHEPVALNSEEEAAIFEDGRDGIGLHMF